MLVTLAVVELTPCVVICLVVVAALEVVALGVVVLTPCVEVLCVVVGIAVCVFTVVLAAWVVDP